MAGVILVVLGLVPKISLLVASIPTFVLGGAGIVMFGMVLATGIRILSQVDYAQQRHNTFIVAISLGMALIPTVAPKFFSQLPDSLEPVLHSGILLASFSAVLLNLYFNGLKQPATQAQT